MNRINNAPVIKAMKKLVKHYKTQRKAAEFLGIHEAVFSSTLRDERLPTKNIAEKLGFKLVKTWVRVK